MPSDDTALQQEVDRDSLESQVKNMYQRVAEDPNGEFHFEMGRALAERLGTPRRTSTAYQPRPSSPSPGSVTTFTWRISRKEKAFLISVAGRERILSSLRSKSAPLARSLAST